MVNQGGAHFDGAALMNQHNKQIYALRFLYIDQERKKRKKNRTALCVYFFIYTTNLDQFKNNMSQVELMVF